MEDNVADEVIMLGKAYKILNYKMNMDEDGDEGFYFVTLAFAILERFHHT